ncbi:unnamed protein product, partial [Clonostachys chloroleuca]
MSIRLAPLSVRSKALGRRLLSSFGKGVHENQTFGLPDDRVLGFTEYGSREGKPLLFFHGYPSSRLEASGVDELARWRGIRVISLDRPGYGLSTTQPNRTIVDWPADVRTFAEGMKLDKFAITCRGCRGRCAGWPITLLGY